MDIKTLKVGDRVRLAAFVDEDVNEPEEDATVLSIPNQRKFPGMLIVQVDNQAADDPDDDRIRELEINQVLRKL